MSKEKISKLKKLIANPDISSAEKEIYKTALEQITPPKPKNSTSPSKITINAYAPVSKAGRIMPPIPTQKTEKYMRQYLIEQALIETKNAPFAKGLVEAIDIKNFSVSDGDTLNDLLWGADVRIDWSKKPSKKTKSAKQEPKVYKESNYTFFEDAGHGWLGVPKKELKELGIESKISGYSYEKGETAYLEEDGDATIYLNAIKKKYGYEQDHIFSSFKNSYKETSPIRSYKSYDPPFQKPASIKELIPQHKKPSKPDNKFTTYARVIGKATITVKQAISTTGEISYGGWIRVGGTILKNFIYVYKTPKEVEDRAKKYLTEFAYAHYHGDKGRTSLKADRFLVIWNDGQLERKETFASAVEAKAFYEAIKTHVPKKLTPTIKKSSKYKGGYSGIQKGFTYFLDDYAWTEKEGKTLIEVQVVGRFSSGYAKLRQDTLYVSPDQFNEWRESAGLEKVSKPTQTKHKVGDRVIAPVTKGVIAKIVQITLGNEPKYWLEWKPKGSSESLSAVVVESALTPAPKKPSKAALELKVGDKYIVPITWESQATGKYQDEDIIISIKKWMVDNEHIQAKDEIEDLLFDEAKEILKDSKDERISISGSGEIKKVTTSPKKSKASATKAKISKSKSKSPEQIEIESQIELAKSALQAAINSFDKKRKELDKGLIEDAENLFGERKSQSESKLFDERADSSQRNKAIEPFKKAKEEAQKTYDKLVKALASEVKTVRGDLFSDKPKTKSKATVTKAKIKKTPTDKVVYIDYRNKDTRSPDRKFFDTYDQAIAWGKKEFEKFSPDMISYASKTDIHYPKIKPTKAASTKAKIKKSAPENKELAVARKKVSQQTGWQKSLDNAYFSDTYNLTLEQLTKDLSEHKSHLEKLLAKQIPPRSIVGTGYKNSRPIAIQWLVERIRNTEYLIKNFSDKNKLTPSQKKKTSPTKPTKATVTKAKIKKSAPAKKKSTRKISDATKAKIAVLRKNPKFTDELKDRSDQSIASDLKRTAKKAGKRKSPTFGKKKGAKEEFYYEYRPEKSDKDKRTKL